MRHWKVYKDRVIGVPTGLLVCVKSPIGKVDTKANDPNLRMVAKVTVPLFPGLSRPRLSGLTRPAGAPYHSSLTTDTHGYTRMDTDVNPVTGFEHGPVRMCPTNSYLCSSVCIRGFPHSSLSAARRGNKTR